MIIKKAASLMIHTYRIEKETGSDPTCMNRLDTTLTNPVVILIAFAQLHSLLGHISTCLTAIIDFLCTRESSNPVFCSTSL